ncbi:hypothetical protein ACIOJE_27690 [Kitasatospora sp. NPDC087861]|uniref:hypothetical protein n=1 Tax=Kitasatospora sp. NPDC087861 TaxID=3364070 RepID=UPI0037FFF7F3
MIGALKYFGRSPAGIADLVRPRLASHLGLLAAVGGARTRMLAQLLADTTELGAVRIGDDPAEALAVLHAQPVRALPGVGPVLERALVRYGVETIGQLAGLPLPTVRRWPARHPGEHPGALDDPHDPLANVLPSPLS